MQKLESFNSQKRWKTMYIFFSNWNGILLFQFDLLSCQDDIINRFFSYLNPDDRMRMRLCKRLHKIEAESKYFIERLEFQKEVWYLI